MPIPAGVILGAKVAAAVAPTAISAVQQGNMNKKNREFSEKMSDKARQQALDDFNMTNAYNLPSNEKKRLIAAGLNPAMMYGGGPGAQPAAIIRGTQPAQTTAQAANLQGLSNILPMLSQLKLVDAQAEGVQLDNATKYQDLVDRVEARNEVGNPTMMKSQILQTELQNAVVMGDINKATSDDQKRKIVHDSLLAVQNAAEAKYRNENLLPLEKERLEKDLENLAFAIKQSESQATILEMNAQLAKAGIYPTDEIYLREAVILLNKLRK